MMKKNVIMEIHGGAGGDEAALFAGDLFHCMRAYAEQEKMEDRNYEYERVTLAALRKFPL